MTPAAQCAGYNRVISDGTEYHCHSAPVSTVIAGCVHEHVGPRDLCGYHTAEVERGEMSCGECLATHHCPLTVLQRTAVSP